MIIIIAPYSPPNKGSYGNLAASKKIEAVIGMLSTFKLPIVLINSAHNSESFKKTIIRKKRIKNVSVIEITPFTVSSRKIGKLLNIIFCFRLFFSKKLNVATNILWLYNPYVFENLSSIFLNKVTNKILEIEDMPMTRNFGLKDKLDKFTMKFCCNKITVFTHVNNNLLMQFQEKYSLSRNILFPGIVSDKVLKDKSDTKETIVGYFGGLNREKGCDILLELIKLKSKNIRFVVTGFGPYSNEFDELNMTHKNLSFYGLVDHEEMEILMNSVDLFLNPHDPLPFQKSGIFPFKICEYVSFNKPVISTKLPSINDIIDESIITVDHNVESFLKAIESYDKIKNDSLILEASNFVRNNFTKDKLIKKINLFNENS